MALLAAQGGAAATPNMSSSVAEYAARSSGSDAPSQVSMASSRDESSATIESNPFDEVTEPEKEIEVAAGEPAAGTKVGIDADPPPTIEVDLGEDKSDPSSDPSTLDENVFLTLVSNYLTISCSISLTRSSGKRSITHSHKALPCTRSFRWFDERTQRL